MRSLTEDRHERALKEWRRWNRAKRQRDRDQAIFDLWVLCEPEIWSAVRRLADKLGDATGRRITVPEWRLLHGLDEDDVRYAAFPAIGRAAKSYDPRKGAAFPTYAYKFILGELRGLLMVGDALSVAEELIEDKTEDESGGESGERPDLWDLFDLRRREQAALLGRLEDPEHLIEIRHWIDENLAVIVERFGSTSGVAYARFFAGYLAWVKQLPPDLRRASLFAEKPKDGLPLEGVAIRTDGKVWDLDLLIRAEILERQGLSRRAIAEYLDVPEPSLRKIQNRAKDLGFSLSKFTPHQLDVIARGKKRGRPKSS